MSDPALDATSSPLRLQPAVRGVESRAATTATATATADKEYLIDALRGFAALLVAYFHCRQVVWIGIEHLHRLSGQPLSLDTVVAWLTLPIAWGSAGVPIFFVISGYCIHRGAAQKLAANPAWRLDVGNFWARRFARIYPVLFAALLVTFALDSISLQLPPVNHKIRELGLHAFLVNLFSLQGIAGKTYGSNGALWTLALEVQFYAVYPLVFALRRRIGMRAVVALVALVNLASAWVLEHHDVQAFPSYWLSWMLGAWIAEAGVQRARAQATLEPSRGWYAAGAALLALGCVAFHFGQYGAFQLWSIGFACCLHAALGRRRARPRQPAAPLRILSRCGDFSYSLYLIHLPFFVLLESLFFRSSLQLSIWPSFAFMLAVLPLAWLFYRVVEVPAMQWSASLKPRATGAAGKSA